MPLAANRSAASSTTSSAKNSNVNRLCPRVWMISGVLVTHVLRMRMRSHGSSRRNRTQTSNTAPPTRSMASNPASSSFGAISFIIAVVIRVAHRHWWPSRIVTSIRRIFSPIPTSFTQKVPEARFRPNAYKHGWPGNPRHRRGYGEIQLYWQRLGNGSLKERYAPVPTPLRDRGHE